MEEKPDLPEIPRPLDEVQLPAGPDSLPSSEEYCVPLKQLLSDQAKSHQQIFKYLAALIIAAHILATLCATGALALHGHGNHEASAEKIAEESLDSSSPDEHDEHESHPTPPHKKKQTGNHAEPLSERAIPILLALELVLLLAGVRFHSKLHHANAPRVWANARVVAEISRSIRAIHPRHLYLEHLFRLPLPQRFRPLLRTLSVLHLRSTRTCRSEPWEPKRTAYVENRVNHQSDYYQRELEKDQRRQERFQALFGICSKLAFLATTIKLILLIIGMLSARQFGLWPQLFGTLAIVLPVLAVAGLSWLAALDCEARVETFKETIAFLKRQENALNRADTGAEFDRLVIETETVLLGEVTNWFSRRANTSVA
ncbi:MAG: SLATT domain-containing protein [Planctomycetales bacterium]|nr:SLATT domain-containing protein [Planctomycetales bacterium]